MRRKINYRQFSGYLRIIFITGLLMLLPTLVYADSTGVALDNTSNSALFTPSSNDQSIIYMGELFGSIPPILAGTGSSLLGNLFKIFNTAVMALGIIIAGYTTFVGILNTAGEGEMLGKGWSSIWVPIKTVVGIALLIPTASGYCVVQIFMMWLLVQGIGAADSLTGGIIDYMESGQDVYVAGNVPHEVYDDAGLPLSTETTLITNWDQTIQYVYQGLSCMQALQKNYPLVNAAYVSPPAPVTSADNSTVTYDFTANKYASSTPNSDGSYTPKSVSCGTFTYSNTTTEDGYKDMNAYLQQGLNAIMPSLNSAAFFMVNDVPVVLNQDGSINTNPSSSQTEDQAMKDTFNFVGSDYMNEVATTYNSYIIQADNASAKPSTNDYLEAIRSYGWITIGNLYWNMAQSSSSGEISDDTVKKAKLKWTEGQQNISDPTYKSTYDINTDDNLTVYEYGYDYGQQFIADLITSRSSDNTDNGNAFKSADKTTYANAANGIMSKMTIDTLQNMQQALGSSTTNPMIAAQRWGHHTLYNVEALMTTFWVLETALLVGFTVAGLSAAGAFGFTFSVSLLIAMIATQIMLLLTMPFLFILYGMLLTLGGILAVVIPLIPALVFFLAAIAWMIATLETIIAAPIVAIGLIHPDGQHPVFGKAEPAIMLMVNMFLRPSLMVIGMAAGVLLSFITVQFVNFGYSQALQSLILRDGTGISWVEATMFMGTYVGLILACVNKSFSVIDALPDTVMRWISGGEATRFGGGQEAMNKLQGTQESAGQKASGDTLSSGQEAGQAGEKLVKKGETATSVAAGGTSDGAKKLLS